MQFQENILCGLLKEENNEPPTLYISNGGQSAINEINMNKINNGAIMKMSAKESATAHILVRCEAIKERFFYQNFISSKNLVVSDFFYVSQ